MLTGALVIDANGDECILHELHICPAQLAREREKRPIMALQIQVQAARILSKQISHSEDDHS